MFPGCLSFFSEILNPVYEVWEVLYNWKGICMCLYVCQILRELMNAILRYRSCNVIKLNTVALKIVFVYFCS
jgi:hypothetical protein